MKPILSSKKSLHRLLSIWIYWVALVPLTSSALDDFLPEEKAYYLCAGCHGPETGAVLYPMPDDIPIIIGQKKDYLLKQLIAYRDGQREHPNMSGIIGNYTDQNLTELAEYYQNLGPTPPQRKTTTRPGISRPLAAQNTSIDHTASKLHKKKAKQETPANAPSSSSKTP